MYLDCKFGLNLSLSEIILLFDLSLYLDRTLAQRKTQRKAKSKVKVAQCLQRMAKVSSVVASVTRSCIKIMSIADALKRVKLCRCTACTGQRAVQRTSQAAQERKGCWQEKEIARNSRLNIVNRVKLLVTVS